MSSSSFVKQLLSGFANALAPLRAAIASPTAFVAFLKQFGWTLPDATVSELRSLLSAISTLATNPSALSVEQLTSDLENVGSIIRKIESSGAPAAFASTFPRELLDYLVYSAVAANVPPLFGLLHFAGVFTEQRRPADSATGRAEYVQVTVHWDRLAPLADEPLETIESAYGWGGTFDGDGFVRSLGILARGFGAPAGIYGADRTLGAQYYARGSPDAAMLKNAIVSVPGLSPSVSSGGATVNVKLAFLAVPIPPNATAVAPADGVAVMPVITGKATDTIALTDTITLTLAGDILARPVRAEFHPGIAVLRATPGDAHFDATAKMAFKAPATGPWIPFGSSDSSHFELSAAHVAFGLSGTVDGDLELTAEIGLDRAALVIDFSEGDSLMQDTVASQPTKSPLSLVVKWSSKTGFSFGGQPKVQVNIPVQETLSSIATLQQIGFALGLGANNRLEFDAMLTAGTTVGPVQMSIKEVGVAIFITPVADTDPPGNLGNIDLGFGFKSPSGVGIGTDVAGLTGGGFLEYDPAQSQYAGMLQLAYQQYQLQAYGLITTVLPTGPGYSFIAMIDANFPPIELVAGFTLNGVGGLLGINRTVSTDALEAGIKAHTLSNFLFAKNAIANAPTLLTDLATFFPAASGSYVFGPLLQIGWGTPTVLTINLALLLTLPDPVRLVLLGELDVLLPDPQEVELEMHMDILGSIDFTADEGSLDAVLHDSRLAHYPLAGAMALRACWAGSSKEFLLAIGGFNPAFQPPASFPTLPRVAINMKSGSIAKLNLAGYVAVTSNTLQIGANIDLAVGVDGFGISGYLNFDTLIQFSPFHFEADISGGIELTAGGDDLMSLDLAASMSGPSPWHVAGKVHFSILGFGVSKSFSETFGDSSTQPALQSVDVGAALRAALGDPRNYSASLTTNQNGLVSLRTPTTTGVALGHPAASLNVDQKIVPLGLTIAKFGAAPPQGDTLFTITATTVDGNTATTVPLNDEFAPAQFLDLSDDQELSSPSFESFDAGVTVAQGAWTVGEAMAGSAVIERTVAYETYLIDTPGGQPRGLTGVTPVQPTHMIPVLSGLFNSGTLRYAGPSQSMVLAPLGYVVATTDQIAVSGVGVATGQTYAQARVALVTAIAQNPNQLGALQVVPVYEVPST
ncbi:MAG TPA: DUF6603 domain-containing protein [Candidatus Acidoferrum sp.]|nr:DUF6603 domain-containing protein [Candidatus Acidoferrum sp.]